MPEPDEIEVYPLPELIYLEDFGGNFAEYLEEIYQIFKEDFIDNKPVFEGKKLGLKKYPLVEGKAYTFYHFTHEGSDEANREPNFRRMERIAWPAPMINNSVDPYLKVWRNKRGRHERVLIFHEEESYLIILEDRKEYILPWTAYLVTYPNRRRRLLKEYETYKNAETAQGD